MEADATITRVTVLDGFRIQGANGQSIQGVGACVTLKGASPTITHNTINAPAEPNGGTSSYGILVLSPTNDPLGALIEANAINGAAAAESSVGVALVSPVLPPLQPGAIAEIKENSIRSGSAKRSRGVEIWTGGNGTRVVGNRISAGSSNNGDSWGIVLAASPIGGQSLIEGNGVNSDPQNLGICSGLVANSGGWCGGIDSQAAKATIVNNFVFGLIAQRSTAVWLRNPEVAPETVVLSSNFLSGGGSSNGALAISAAITLTVNNGNNTLVGRIHNNVLVGGVASSRFGVFEDSTLGKTCHPEALTNNDFFLDPAGSPGDIFYRFWDGVMPQKYSMLAQVNALDGAAKNFSGDPQLDAMGHIAAGSPCVDSGTATEAPPTDFEGTPRPKGNGYDVGPDER